MLSPSPAFWVCAFNIEALKRTASSRVVRSCPGPPSMLECSGIPPRAPAMSDFKQLSRSVKGLTVLVTGAGSGMGRATARVFAAEGAQVAVTDFDAVGAQ